MVALLVISALPATLGPSSAHPVAQVARAGSPTSPTRSLSPVMLSAPAPDERPPLLTLDMAVGQMMAASFGGPDITEGLRRLILDEKVGTVLIFRDNFTDAANLNRLTTQLLRLGREAGLPGAPLVGADGEGGRGVGRHA